jgi:hypothetical protein
MSRIAQVALLIGIAGVAYAQDSVTIDLERIATGTPEEMREFAEESVGIITDNAETVKALTEKARKAADAAALDCLTPRNVSASALVQVAVGAQAKMNEKLDEGDMERAGHETRKIGVARNKSEKLTAEAEECASGESASGTTRTTFTGGTGDENDTVDDDEIKEEDVGFDPPDVSPSTL